MSPARGYDENDRWESASQEEAAVPGPLHEADAFVHGQVVGQHAGALALSSARGYGI